MAPAKLKYLPLDRVLTETDHPVGNRAGVGFDSPAQLVISRQDWPIIMA
jgi:Tat protein secretion system quality control protein TatD with DNase activity